jgi:hypothetical protein
MSSPTCSSRKKAATRSATEPTGRHSADKSIAIAAAQANSASVDKERSPPSAPPTANRRWTGADDYVVALARRRSARRSRAPRPRSEPETPRLLLSTLPFLILLGALAVIAVGIMIAAFPGTQAQPQPKPTAREIGTAPKGWLNEAEQKFH